MRPFLIFAVAAIAAVVLQTTLPRWLGILPAAPDLILVLTVYLGLHVHTVNGAIGAFLLGCLLDSFSGSPPGLHAFTASLVFLVVYLLSQRLWIENPLSNIAAVALGAVVKVATVVIYFAIAGGVASWGHLFRVLGLEALFAMLLTPPVFTLLSDNLAPRRGGWGDGAD